MKFGNWVREVAKETINKGRKLLRLVCDTAAVRGAAVCGMALLIGGAFSARAEGTKQSFGTTNSLVTAVDMRTWPTNSTGTNFTGGSIDVRNYQAGGYYFEGDVVTAGTGTVTLVRSPYTSPTSYSNWESVAQITLTIPMPTAGHFIWMTNLDQWFEGPANFVGINRMTNAAGNVTNLDQGLTKKIIPPGNKS